LTTDILSARVRTTGVLVHRRPRGLRRLWAVVPIGLGHAGQLRPRTCGSSPVRAEGPESSHRLWPCVSFRQARCRPVKLAGKSTSRGATSPPTRTGLSPTNHIELCQGSSRKPCDESDANLRRLPTFHALEARPAPAWDCCPPSLHGQPESGFHPNSADMMEGAGAWKVSGPGSVTSNISRASTDGLGFMIAIKGLAKQQHPSSVAADLCRRPGWEPRSAAAYLLASGRGEPLELKA